MFSFNNAKVQNHPLPCEERKIEVAIEPCEDEMAVVLRYSTWTDGLGWCDQKTIRIDSSELDELHRALSLARYRIARKRAEAGEVREPAKVIQLPTLA